MKDIGDIKIVGEERPFRICVVSFPMPSALVVNVFLYSLVEILELICERIYVVTSNIPKDRIFSEKIRIQDVKSAMHFRETIRPRWWSTVLQFFKIMVIQMKMCWVLTKISKEINIVIFYVGGANLFFPVLMAKVLRKKVITSALGLGSLEEVNQVWGIDITYIRMKHGWLYLVAIMDWVSRYVLSWELSTTLEIDFCIRALDKALSIATPEIFNSDQGGQFTSVAFLRCPEERSIQVSMDGGGGRAMDNVLTERLWRSVKYEEVYLNDYGTVSEAKQGIGNYIAFYNQERPHQSLTYKTPAEMYFDSNNQNKRPNCILDMAN